MEENEQRTGSERREAVRSAYMLLKLAICLLFGLALMCLLPSVHRSILEQVLKSLAGQVLVGCEDTSGQRSRTIQSWSPLRIHVDMDLMDGFVSNTSSKCCKECSDMFHVKHQTNYMAPFGLWSFNQVGQSIFTYSQPIFSPKIGSLELGMTSLAQMMSDTFRPAQELKSFEQADKVLVRMQPSTLASNLRK